ncbi:MAG: heme exporter protein CcmB [Bacteroidetes bacterium]|nr:heme exporter protein CcmB [Bacteroidota bacterium]
MLDLARIAAVVRKDVRSELRNRYSINALAMFVVTAVATILFALRSESPGPASLSGMYWVVVFFSAMSGLARVFVSEEERGTALTLQLTTSSGVLFAGKLAVNVALTMLLTAAVTALYLIAFPTFVLRTPETFLLTVIFGSIGFASASTILAAIIAKANSRGTLYPVLAFPVLIPLLMTVMSATERALEGEPLAAAAGDLQVLVGYCLIMIAGSFLLFDFVWSE